MKIPKNLPGAANTRITPRSYFMAIAAHPAPGDATGCLCPGGPVLEVASFEIHVPKLEVSAPVSWLPPHVLSTDNPLE